LHDVRYKLTTTTTTTTTTVTTLAQKMAFDTTEAFYAMKKALK